jgi:hypothetical protein
MTRRDQGGDHSTTMSRPALPGPNVKAWSDFLQLSPGRDDSRVPHHSLPSLTGLWNKNQKLPLSLPGLTRIRESHLPKHSDALRLFVLLLLIFSSAPLCAQTNQKLRIAEKIWGFDGRVVNGQFMPLSIELDNLSDEPIEAVATLRSVTGMIRETGGTATQSVFMGPHSRRWVQFYPYIGGMNSSWRFELRTPEETFRFDPIDQPRSVLESNTLQMKQDDQTLPAVILDRPDARVKIPTTVKHMTEEVFPPYATATHGLYAMFMDHVPDWETPRQEAMLSWLKSGGQLHLLQDQNNQTLRFSGVLAALNEPFAEFSVGTGHVTRHEIQRAQLSQEIVTPAITPQALSKKDVDEIEQYEQQYGNGYGFGFGTSVSDNDDLFAELRKLTQPEHLWWLIFLLSLCYVGLIFPGCWILSRQRNLHFLTTYGCIAGLAAVFSLMFLFIGRRGYGETTSLHSVAIAHAEDDTHASLLQLTTLFVTEGNTYSVTDRDHQSLLASAASEESVDARITSGNTAIFVSRIPPYSSQAILSRRRFETENWNLAVTSLNQQGNELQGLTIAFGEKLPNDPQMKCLVIHGRNLYQTSIDRSTKVISLNNQRELLSTFCAPSYNQLNGIAMTQDSLTDETEATDPAEEYFKEMLPDLVRCSLIDDWVRDVGRFRLPDDRVRLLIYTSMSEDQQFGVDGEVRRVGKVLYVRDLLLNPNNQDNSNGSR